MARDWTEEECAELEENRGETDFRSEVEQLIIRREIKEPMHVKIEAQVTVDGTFIKFWHVPRGDHKFYHLIVDTMKPEPLVEALEQRMYEGRFHDVINFLEDEGHAIRDPIEFRLKLDANLGLSGSGVAGDPLF